MEIAGNLGMISTNSNDLYMAEKNINTYRKLLILTVYIHRTIIHDMHTWNRGKRSAGGRAMQKRANDTLMTPWVRKGLTDDYWCIK